MLKETVRALVPASFWEKCVRWRASKTLAWRYFRKYASVLGQRPAMALSLSKVRTPRLNKSRCLRSLRLGGFKHPLYYRANTSDLDVVWQVFGDRQYEPVAEEKDVRLIIDCGANIGCASFYFLHRYPTAHVIAVEPDSENFAVCARNLRPFAERITLVNMGIWHSQAQLRVVRGGFGDGREWSFQVRPALPTEQPDITAVTIDDLLSQSGERRIDLLKIDIEGAELVLLENDPERWLTYTRNLAIELHGAACERLFAKAMADYDYHPGQLGDTTFCRDIKPRVLSLGDKTISRT